MTALQIDSMKVFMNQLLASDAFDSFLLEEAIVRTSISYTIDGHMNRDFFSREEQNAGELCPYDLITWKEIRGLCFQLIKGKRTPLSFKFVLQLMPSRTEALLQKAGSGADSSQVKAFVLNIRYDGQKAVLTTGTSYRTFLLDKEADAVWDKALMNYLTQKGIGYERL